MKDKIENILIKLGSLDRRVIFIIIALSVTIPLIKPNWVALPIIAKPETIKVFEECDKLEEKYIVLIQTSRH